LSNITVRMLSFWHIVDQSCTYQSSLEHKQRQLYQHVYFVYYIFFNKYIQHRLRFSVIDMYRVKSLHSKFIFPRSIKSVP